MTVQEDLGGICPQLKHLEDLPSWDKDGTRYYGNSKWILSLFKWLSCLPFGHYGLLHGVLWYCWDISVWWHLCFIVLQSFFQPRTLISQGDVLLWATCRVTEPAGKVLTQKEGIPMPFKYAAPIVILTLVLSRPRRFSWKSGVEMEGHEKMQEIVWRGVGVCVCRREKWLCYH